ncbi:hypothetical protein Pelo_3405 [Pelomyxa schiedti]|nr:hypothetical protein Pelo_3405 [Pelomyxa schiedti]
MADGAAVGSNNFFSTHRFAFAGILGAAHDSWDEDIKKFGGTCVDPENLDDKPTILIANATKFKSKTRTARMKQAIKHPEIIVVGPGWLKLCLKEERLVPMMNYIIRLEPQQATSKQNSKAAPRSVTSAKKRQASSASLRPRKSPSSGSEVLVPMEGCIISKPPKPAAKTKESASSGNQKGVEPYAEPEPSESEPEPRADSSSVDSAVMPMPEFELWLSQNKRQTTPEEFVPEMKRRNFELATDGESYLQFALRDKHTGDYYILQILVRSDMHKDEAFRYFPYHRNTRDLKFAGIAVLRDGTNWRGALDYINKKFQEKTKQAWENRKGFISDKYVLLEHTHPTWIPHPKT